MFGVHKKSIINGFGSYFIWQKCQLNLNQNSIQKEKMVDTKNIKVS